MKFQKKKRSFIVNNKTNLKIKNVGKISLLNKEHLTIEVNKKKNEVCAFDWGMYATSSINKRLKKEKLKTFIVKNKEKKFFIMLVDTRKMRIFNKYLISENLKVVKILN